jgi:hypothetical protein
MPPCKVIFHQLFGLPFAGKHVNLRVEELFEEAKEMSHTKWSEWIVMQIQFPDTL